MPSGVQGLGSGLYRVRALSFFETDASWSCVSIHGGSESMVPFWGVPKTLLVVLVLLQVCFEDFYALNNVLRK